MIKVKLSEFKKKLTGYVKKLDNGQIVTLLNEENKPFTQINSIKKAVPAKREFGRAKGTYEVSGAFFD